MCKLSKPLCPFCYESCIDPDCMAINCDGNKDSCRKALYCRIYPYKLFCTPELCVPKLRLYFDQQILRSADSMLNSIIEQLTKRKE